MWCAITSLTWPKNSTECTPRPRGPPFQFKKKIKENDENVKKIKENKFPM